MFRSLRLRLSTLLLYTSLCAAASYKETTPPDYLIYSYPTNDVTLGDTVFLGFDGAGSEVPHDYYGLGYNMSISTTYPNGTNELQVAMGTLLGSVGVGYCKGNGQTPSKPGDPMSGVRLTVDAVGQHTSFWNVTYGTNDDPSVSNGTSCDPSRLSYQSWLFNATWNVVDSQGQSGHLAPHFTTVTTQFPSEPTGKILESNGAATGTTGLGTVLGVFAVVLLQVF